MTVKAFMPTNGGDIAISPTEKPSYKNVIPKMVRENVDTPTAAVVSSMIANEGKEAAMRIVIEYQNSYKSEEEKNAVIKVAEEEIGYISPEASFEEKLHQKLKGVKTKDINPAPMLEKTLKYKMAPR